MIAKFVKIRFFSIVLLHIRVSWVAANRSQSQPLAAISSQPQPAAASRSQSQPLAASRSQSQPVAACRSMCDSQSFCRSVLAIHCSFFSVCLCDQALKRLEQKTSYLPFRILAVGVGGDVQQSQLNSIAADTSYALKLHDWSCLLFKRLCGIICDLPLCPPPP